MAQTNNKNIIKWLANQPPYKWIGLIVAAAPTAVYQYIQRVYGNQYPFFYQPGFEKTPASKISMQNFLVDRMNEVARKGSAAAFVNALYSSIQESAINFSDAADYINING